MPIATGDSLLGEIEGMDEEGADSVAGFPGVCVGEDICISRCFLQ